MGLLPTGKEVVEVCNKAETWLKLRTGVTQAARSMAKAGARAGHRERGRSAAAVTVLAQAGCAHLGSVHRNITPWQRLH